jgi:hypothetical protein
MIQDDSSIFKHQKDMCRDNTGDFTSVALRALRTSLGIRDPTWGSIVIQPAMEKTWSSSSSILLLWEFNGYIMLI